MMWGVLGIIVTIIIGVLPFIIHKKKKQCEITYIPTESFNLFYNLKSCLESIEVLHSKTPIKDNLLFLSGTFVCSGDSDIVGNNHIIKIELPEGCKWVENKICKSSRDFNPSFLIDDKTPREVIVGFDLFKKDEFFSIQGLVECENKDYTEDVLCFHKKLKFFHRIQNTDMIKVGEAVTTKKSWTRFCVFSFFLVLFTVLMFLTLGSSCKMENLVYKNIATQDEYYAYLSDNNTILLQKRNIVDVLLETTSKEISLNEFKTNYKESYDYDYLNPRIVSFVIVLVIYYILFLSLLIPEFILLRNNNKLYTLYHSLD